MNVAVFREIEHGAGLWVDWMVEMSWQIVLLVLVLHVLTRLFQRRSAVFLHALWMLVLIRLVVPPDFAFPTGWAWWLGPVESPDAYVATDLQTEEPALMVDGGRAARAVDSTVPIISYGLLLMLAWGAVAATLLGVLMLGSLRVRCWVRQARPVEHPGLLAQLEECRKQLGIRRPVALKNSESCVTPLVVGIRRPVILLPEAVLYRLEPDEVKAVLVHELNHIARHDALINLLQGLLTIVYFFHPLVWWANRRIRELREDACDELTVAALGGRRKAYGSALVKVTEMLGYAAPPLSLGIMESKSPAKQRLERILDPNLPSGRSLGWHSLAAVALAGAVLLPGGFRTTAAVEPAAAAPPFPQAPQVDEQRQFDPAVENSATDAVSPVPAAQDEFDHTSNSSDPAAQPASKVIRKTLIYEFQYDDEFP
jgi:bla regulator protein blaR1